MSHLAFGVHLYRVNCLRCCSSQHSCVGCLQGGSLTRGKHQDRIGFLAQARNHALEPLWLSTAQSASTGAHVEALPRVPMGRLPRVPMMVGEALPAKSDAHAIWQAEHVVFLNDVYFCAQDVPR